MAGFLEEERSELNLVLDLWTLLVPGHCFQSQHRLQKDQGWMPTAAQTPRNALGSV